MADVVNQPAKLSQCLYVQHNGKSKGSLESCILLRDHVGEHEWKIMTPEEQRAFIDHSKGR